MDIEGDAFGKVYEYFLGEFAMSEGRRGGEYFTPTPIVKLIVDIIEPFHGRILDPACGSGGMFVQSARFVQRHTQNPSEEISIYGQDKESETVRLCKMNLAVHGLSGDIREGNSYYEDIHDGVGKFDFVMANPPANVDRVDKARIEGDQRFVFGIPRADNANYLWIQAFYSALNATGRAGFVMANSAGDARASELELRRQLIEARAVDVVVSVGPNFFYTVTLPVTLWFLDRGKIGGERADRVLFIDARPIHRQVDRAHRDLRPWNRRMCRKRERLARGCGIPAYSQELFFHCWLWAQPAGMPEGVGSFGKSTGNSPDTNCPSLAGAPATGTKHGSVTPDATCTSNMRVDSFSGAGHLSSMRRSLSHLLPSARLQTPESGPINVGCSSGMCSAE
jgi:type I restriction enzyme M protein